MTEQELRNKIAKHVCCACEMGLGDGECAERSDYRKCGVCGDVADALISAGIVDKSDYASMKETAVRYKAEVSKAGARAKEAEHRAEVAEHELERRLAEATKAMYVYERALYYATLNGETADEVKYNDALKRAQKDFAENKGD